MRKSLLSMGAALLAMSATAQSFDLGEAFSYKIDPTFKFECSSKESMDDFENLGQYPANALRGQASLETNVGMANAFFSQHLFETDAQANEEVPVVADPYNNGQYVIKMQADTWWAYGNLNFALPEVGEPCRVRCIFRIDETAQPNPFNGGQKLFRVKLMTGTDQENPEAEVSQLNDEFWATPGWYVAEFNSDLDSDKFYLSILFDGGGLSCGRKVPFYVKEVSAVPVSKLTGYTAPAEGKSLAAFETMPELVKVGGSTAIEGVESAAAVAVEGLAGAVAINGFEGTAELYNAMGQLIAKAEVNGQAEVAAPAGIVIVKAGEKVAKVVVR